MVGRLLAVTGGNREIKHLPSLALVKPGATSKSTVANRAEFQVHVHTGRYSLYEHFFLDAYFVLCLFFFVKR